ncbi:MAG: type II secretion system F family protein [Pseudomonadota bacterium]
MPIFIYTALSAGGSVISGETVALSAAELTQELASRGLLVQQVRQKRAGLMSRRRHIKPELFLLYNQELMALIRAGLTIPEALKLAADRPGHRELGETLQRVLEDVRQGVALSEACRRHPDVFDSLYVATLQTGEKTGSLAQVLARYHRFLQKRVELQKKVSHALVYPVFLLGTLMVILVALFIFVLPRFAAMYSDFGAELPLPTRLLMGVAEYLPVYLPILVLASVTAAGAWRMLQRNEAARVRMDRFKMDMPLFGSMQRDLAVIQITRTLETLLAGGMPLVESLHTCQDAVTNCAARLQVRRVMASVIEGASVAEAMRGAQLMPDTALKMIEVGEATGELGAMLGEAARFYEEIMDTRVARLMALMEPAMMLLIGLVIGGIIIVMYLPIFYIADVVQ